ncbi:hypothetical protein OK016_00545 [Vibrio chagasii]|nr:hypothetical protein [Vibrio chagasii]
MLIIMTVTSLGELLILSTGGFCLYIKQSQEQEMGLKALGVAARFHLESASARIIEEKKEH